MSPTRPNVQRIAQDIADGLYSSYHISFTSSVPKPLLEELASLLLEADSTGALGEQVAAVYDQFLDFVVPSSSLFQLLPKRIPAPSETNGNVIAKPGKVERPREIDAAPSYKVLNDPKAGEVEIEEEAERIARGLFSVIVTMGNIPIIRAPRGNAAEMVARKLDAKLRDYITSSASGRGSSYSGGGFGDGLSSLQRPCEFNWENALTLRVWPTDTSLCYLTISARDPRSKCGSDPNAIAFMDLSSPRPRRPSNETEQGDGRIT